VENRFLSKQKKQPMGRRVGSERDRTGTPGSTTQMWKSDDELFAIVERELFTCVVGDVMDKLAFNISSCRRRFSRCGKIWW
jgi:hypothetical protein